MLLKFVGISSVLATAFSQTVVETHTYDIAQPEDFSPESILEIHLNDTALVDKVFNHGCFCSKIYSWNNKNVRGGHVAIDTFDEICKNWFRCRECNDKLVGGSCKDGGYDPHTNSLTYKLVQSVYDDNSVTYDCTQNADACAMDTCLIDVEYVSEMAEYLEGLSSEFIATGLNDGINCPRSGEPLVARLCNGTAPNLFTTKQAQFVNAQRLAALTIDPCEDGTKLDTSNGQCVDELVFHTFNEYKYYPVRVSDIQSTIKKQTFKVDARNDAHMIMCPDHRMGIQRNPTSNPTSMLVGCAEVVLGGWGNSQSVLRSTPQGTNHIVVSGAPLGTPTGYGTKVGFVVEYSNDDLIVYREGVEFMRLANYENYLAGPIISVGVSTGFGSEGDWYF